MNETSQDDATRFHAPHDAVPRVHRLTTHSWFVVLVGAGVAIVTFGFRFLSFRGLPNDQYMHLAWAQQLLSGELPGRDFIEAGMPLAIALSAGAQWVTRSPLSEAVLSIAMLACAAAVTWVVVMTLTRSTLAGIGAVLLEVALYPRLYSYPKILVPAVALLLMIRYVRRPSTMAIVMLPAWTVVAFLLRHDLGLVTAFAITSGLLLAHAGDRGRTGRVVGTYLACGLCLVAPYLTFLHWSGGIAEHVRVGMEFGKADSHQLLVAAVPEFPAWTARSLADWNMADAGALVFWYTNALIVGFLLTVVARWKRVTPYGPVLVGALMFLVCYRLYILRHPVAARVQDLATLLAIGAAWTTAEAVRIMREYGRRSLTTLALAALTSAAVLTIAAGTWTLRDLREDFDETEVSGGWHAIGERAAAVIADGAAAPWPQYWPSGPFPDAIGYIDSCTAASDRLLVTWRAPEYYYFTGRRFAAGHSQFLPGRAFLDRTDQELMLARLGRQTVPIVLMNDSDRSAFVASYPLVAAYIGAHYRPGGQFVIYDGSNISILVRTDLTPTSTYGPNAWPCGFRPS